MITTKARLLTSKERDELLRQSVRGGTLTVGDALEFRQAKLEAVEVRPNGDVVATASSPKGVLVQLGTDQYDRHTGELRNTALFDCIERLAMTAVRS